MHDSQVDVCLFDKTGTITSDRLVAETLVAPQSLHPDNPPEMVKLPVSNIGGVNDTGGASEMSPVVIANSKAILASEVRCHNHKLLCLSKHFISPKLDFISQPFFLNFFDSKK